MPRISWFGSRPRRVHHVSHFEGVLGTSLELQLVAGSENEGRVAEEMLLAEIDRLEAIFNAYHPGSELSQWQTTSHESVPVSRELAGLLLAAENWRVRTRNAFNPAVEALTRVWTDHASRNSPVSPRDLSSVLDVIDSPLWEVDLAHQTARRLTTLPVTLNSIAKGFILDCACLAARQTPGVQEVLLNIGGDLRHHGFKPVPISIADPRRDAENALPADRVRLLHQGVATSGNYRRGFQIQGRWYSHVLDPRTGYPVEHLVGVSVLAPDAATADVLATAFSVLAPAESLELADSLENVGVLLLAFDGARHANSFWNHARI